jgi:hypothetical protein
VPAGVLHRPLRWWTAGLALAGVGLAGFGAVRAFRAGEAGAGVVFIAVALVLSALTALVLAGWRPAGWAALLLLVPQPPAAVGSAIELTLGVSGGKADELRRLGVDPTAGVAINLGYSAVGSVLFAWYAARWLAARRSAR